MKTLKLLQDYFSTTDNTYVKNKLRLLEMEIELAILEANRDGFAEGAGIVKKHLQ